MTGVLEILNVTLPLETWVRLERIAHAKGLTANHAVMGMVLAAAEPLVRMVRTPLGHARQVTPEVALQLVANFFRTTRDEALTRIINHFHNEMLIPKEKPVSAKPADWVDF